MYSIAIIGIDRYLRIKKYANFKELWTTKVVLIVLSIAFFLALTQAQFPCLVIGKADTVIPIYFGIDLILYFTNTLHSEFTIVTSAKINKGITKLSMRVKMLCFFIARLHIVTILQNDIQDQLSDYGKSLLEFRQIHVRMLFCS